MDIGLAMMHLEDLGVKEVLVKYSGGGDSGDIDTVEYLTKDNKYLSMVDAGVIREAHTILVDKSYILLEDVEDWYNNEGGYGIITYSIPSGDYTIDNNVNYTASENYTHTGSLDKFNDEQTQYGTSYATR